MPLIPVSPEQRQAQSAKGESATSLRASKKAVVPQAARTSIDYDEALGPLSDKAVRRGGTYGFGAAANDIAGGFIKGLALLPDAAINAIARSTEKQQGLEEGTLGRDFLNRALRSGNYEDAEWLIPGLIKMAEEGPDLGTGRGIGNVLERTAEFGALAIPFAGALNAMAQASKASKAARLGIGADTGGVPMSKFIGPSRPAVDPASGRALGAFAPTTTRGKLGEMMIAPYRANPGTLGRAGRVEMGFGALSGLGAGVEQEMFGGSGLTGGLVAPLAAPLVLGGAKGFMRLSPIRAVGARLKGSTAGVTDDVKVAERLYAGKGTEVAQEEGSAAARNLVAQYLKGLEGRPQTADSLERVREIQNEFGTLLFGPDGKIPFQLAEILDDPITTARTSATIRRGGDDALRWEEARVEDILKRIKNYYDNELSVGVGSGNPGESVPFVIDQLRNRFDEVLSANKTEAGELKSAVDDLIPSLDQGERALVGGNTRENVINARNAAIKRFEERATKEGINDADQLGTNADWKNFVEEVRGTFLPALQDKSLTREGLPRTIQRVLSRDDDFALSFQDWKQTRQDISGEIARFYDVGNGAEASRLQLFADMWDDFATRGAGKTTLESRSPNLQRSGNNLLRYLEDYRNEVSAPFENRYFRTIRQRAGGTDDFPLYQTNAENVTDQFLNSVEGIRTFKQVYGPDGLVKDPAIRNSQMSNLRNALLDRANTEVVRNGSIGSGKLDSFRNKYSEVIKELEMDDVFADIASTAENTAQRLATLTERGEAVMRNKLYRQLEKYVDADAVNQEVLFDSLVTPGNRQILSDIRKQALEGGFEKQWNQVVLDSLNKKVFNNIEGDILNQPSALLKHLANRNNRITLNNALGEAQVDRIQLLADFADRVNKVFPKNADGSVNFGQAASMNPQTLLTKVFESVGTSVPQATTRFIAIQEGRIGYRAAMAYFLARAINSGSSARYDAVLTEALTNPSFAQQIMKEAPMEMLPNNQVGLPLQGPRETVLDFFFKRGVPATFILGSEKMAGELDPEVAPPPVTEEVVETVTQAPPAPVPTSTPAPAPPPPPPPTGAFAGTPPAPTGIAATQQQPQPTANYQELFPFDTTGQAIQRRRGIGGLGVV